MAKNVKAVKRGLCGQVMACEGRPVDGNDYCILKPHSDAIGHTSRIRTDHPCAGLGKPYESCPVPWVHSNNDDPPPPQLVDVPEPHRCPEILIVNEEFYRTILELITSGGESMRGQYADAVILIAQRIKDRERIPGTTAWIGDDE